MIRATVPTQGVIHVIADTQYEIAMTFMRMQEFYESALPDIRGKYFSLEQYMDSYAHAYGNFTYTQDWNGFNVPGHVVKEFFKRFDKKLSDKEISLLWAIMGVLQTPMNEAPRFYLIGSHTAGGHVIDHELAHAMYYLRAAYARKQDELIKELPDQVREKIFAALARKGYGENVLFDETQAYLSTSRLDEIVQMFKAPIKRAAVNEFRANLKQELADADR